MNKIIFIHGLLGSKNNFEHLEKEFTDYSTESIELVGFGGEQKPKIKYDVNDFLYSLERKLNLNEDSDVKLILIGHSMGSLLAKELAIRHPNRILKIFLISYPFFDKEIVLKQYSYFDRKYAKGTWWTKLICQTEIIYKWIFYPYFYLFKYKHRQSYIDFFKHTYHSAHSAIKNTIFEDNKENLYAIEDKIVLINGEKDRSVDFTFSKYFKAYIIDGMGHIFFGHEEEISNIIKKNI